MAGGVARGQPVTPVRGHASCFLFGWMAFGVKALLWLGVIALPGGVLLLPLLYAVHRRERTRAALAAPVEACPHTDSPPA